MTVNKDNRRRAAEERKEISDKRTPQERVALLDSLFGEGKGASKERSKLAKLMQDDV